MTQEKFGSKPGSNAPKPLVTPARQDQGKVKEKDIRKDEGMERGRSSDSADKSKKGSHQGSEADSDV